MRQLNWPILKWLCYNKYMLKETLREGFTLVELSLSMVFIGILSIAIVLIINNTVSAYRRGLMLSQVNTTGIGLVDSMRAAVQNSSVKTLTGSCATIYSSSTERTKCEKDGAYRFVSVIKTGKVKINGGRKTITVPIYGAFCTGSYSYIWNSGYFESDDATFDEKNSKSWAKLKYLNTRGEVREINGSSEDSNRPFRLLKVEDNSRAVCIAATGQSRYAEPSGGISNVFDVTSIGYGMIQETPEDLLVADNSNNLAIYDLAVTAPAESPSGTNAFYSVSFILGTINGGINILAKGNTCATPTDYANENFNYCAINKFNFAVQVNGE